MADTITASVYRYDPSVDERPFYTSFEVPRLHPQMSVLQVIRYIHDHLEPLSFEYSCRAGACGSCSVTVNGVPGQGCSVASPDVVTIEPLKGFRVIKDLIVDKDDVKKRLNSVSPWFNRMTPMTAPETMPPGAFEKVSGLQNCKDALCCQSVCPVIDEMGFDQFAGPYVMVKIAARYFDTREGEAEERLKTAVRNGLFNCTECGLCYEVCPVGRALETPGYPRADIHHVEIFREMKADAVAKGWRPAEGVAADTDGGRNAEEDAAVSS